MSLPQNLGRLSAALTSDASLNIGVGVTPSGSFKLEVGTTSKFTGVATFGSTLSNGTYSYTLPGATGTLALVGGAGVGTVTSVAAITLGTTGTDLSSTVATGTTTPVITLQVPTASATNRGALSSADWSTFNGKQSTITLTTTGTSGAATFSANTLNIPNYADGGVLSLSAIGAVPNANAATITGTVLNLQPADASFGGVVTTGTQTFAGAKTLTGALSGTSASFSSSVTATKFIVGTDLGYALNITTSGFGAILQSTGSSANIPLVALNSATSGGNNIISLQTDAGVERLAFRYDRTGDRIQLVAAGSGFLFTGAATFSSSVSVNTTNAVSVLEIGAVESDGTGSTNALRIQSKTGASNQQLLIGVNQTGTYSFLQSSQASVGYKPLSLNPNGGNVGIGVTSPTNCKLAIQADWVSGNSTVKAYPITSFASSGLAGYGIFDSDGTTRKAYFSSNSTNVEVWGQANVPMVFATNDTERMRITSGGEVYIAGTTDQGAYNLQCNGTGVWGAGAYVNGSDLRLKEDIKPILSGLGYVNKMNPVSFKYLESYSRDRSIQTGFIAQELIEVFKDEEWVDGIVKQGTEHYNVAYQAIIPVLVKAIQELKAEIDLLKGIAPIEPTDNNLE